MEWSNIYLIIFYASKSLHIRVAKNLFIEHISSFGKWRLADVQGCFVFGLMRVLNFTLRTFLPKNDFKAR